MNEAIKLKQQLLLTGVLIGLIMLRIGCHIFIRLKTKNRLYKKYCIYYITVCGMYYLFLTKWKKRRFSIRLYVFLFFSVLMAFCNFGSVRMFIRIYSLVSQTSASVFPSVCRFKIVVQTPPKYSTKYIFKSYGNIFVEQQWKMETIKLDF